MDNQFTDLLVPDIENNYHYFDNEICVCKGFTHLMKLVLCVNKYSDAIDIIKNIIAESPEEINKRNECGQSALWLASINSSTHSNNNVIKLLIDSGANVDLPDNDGDTPLIIASEFSGSNSNNETVKILIASGANVNFINDDGYTPLISASKYDQNIEAIKILIAAGTNINTQCEYGYSALMVAAMRKNNKIVKTLIKLNANVSLCDNDGHSALFLYVIFDKENNINKKILETLIVKSKIFLNVPDKFNKTVYDYYISENYNVLDEYFLRILRGEIFLANTKSAKI